MGLGQRAPRRSRVEVALVFVMNHQIAEAHQFDGRDSFMRAVIEMLDLGVEVLGKHLFDPFPFHYAGQPQQSQIGRTARRDLAIAGGDKKSCILHHALAQERAAAAFGQIALQRALVPPDAKLIDEASHDAPEQVVIRLPRSDGRLSNFDCGWMIRC